MPSREISSLKLPLFRVRECVYPAGLRLARHAHDQYTSVTAVLSGDMEETTDSGEYRARSCSVLIKPAGTLHANHALGRLPARTISIEMGAESTFRIWSWRDDTAAACAALRLHEAVRGCNAERIEASAHHLLAVVTPPAPRESQPDWLPIVLDILADRFDQSVRFEEISRAVGLHPVYLARAFRRYTGTSMGDYVRGLRLQHARHLLAATERSIGSIAADAGFSDPSHLSRLFAAGHAMTPRAYRRLCRG